MESFGLCKQFKDGRNITCKECRVEDNADRWTRKYGRSKRYQPPEILRAVLKQNSQVLQHALLQPTFECTGFIPHTDRIFRIHFGRNRYDMESMAVFSEDGTSYFEIAYSGVKQELRMSQLAANLKEHGIRLEFSEAYMLASKNVIYWYK